MTLPDLDRVIHTMNVSQSDSFVALDVETTGFSPHLHRIIEVAAVRFTRDAVLETFDTLIDARCHIPAEATAVHGISKKDLAGCPPPDEALDQLVRFIGCDRSLVIAHNASFDARFLATEMTRSALALPPWRIVDSLPLVMEVVPGAANRRLSTVAAELGLEHVGQHRALGDATTLAKVMQAILRQDPVKGPSKINQAAKSLAEWAPPPEPPPAGYEALGTERKVEILYFSNGAPRLEVVKPFGVYRFEDRLTLVGRCEESGLFERFGLDKIVMIDGCGVQCEFSCEESAHRRANASDQFRQGNRVPVIAQQLGLSPSTILSYLCEAACRGIDIPVCDLLTDAKRAAIEASLEGLGWRKLKLIKEHLGEEVSYDEINLARALYLRRLATRNTGPG